jgi:hypothetical protein
MGVGQRVPIRHVRRRWPVVVALLVVVASVVPMTWPVGRDSFPLTSYPMFSGRRESSTFSLVLTVGDSAEGTIALPTEATGHRHVTQAAQALRDAVADGGARTQRFCEEVSSWVATEPDLAEVEQVRIVTAAFDGISYFTLDQRDPEVVAEHARCPVAR